MLLFFMDAKKREINFLKIPPSLLKKKKTVAECMNFKVVKIKFYKINLKIGYW